MKFLIILTILTCFLISCQESSPNTNDDIAPPPEIIEEPDRVIITDRTGKKWDITHAVNEYGFKPENFQFGLGPFAIRSIQNPQMLNPGDTGYPGPADKTPVIGTQLNGDTRAYSLQVLVSHEIANEQFGDAHVSVAY